MTGNQAPGRARLAVISTPRSGNTWLRGLLAQLVEGQEIAQHTPDEIPWDALPERVVLQIHWEPTPAFRRLLDDAGFQVVTIVRHPLDVLMSILHFCRHEAQTARWLDGADGDERSILGAAPQDRAVAQYAAGPRLRRLLGVSNSWWGIADAAVSYEDLVAAPEEALGLLAKQLRIEVSAERVAEIVASRRLDVMRSTSSNHHYWQGTPGGWRRLLPAAAAREIAGPIADILTAGGYTVDPLPGLGVAEAQRNWAAVEAPPAPAPAAVPAQPAVPAQRVPDLPVREAGRRVPVLWRRRRRAGQLAG